MQITVRGKNRHVPRTIQDFAVRKFEHLGRYLSTITSIDVELYEDGKPKGGRGHVAHVTVSTSGPVFRYKAVSEDFHTSIDVAMDRLERKVKEFKRRRSGRPAHSRTKAQSSDIVKGAGQARPEES